MLKKPVPALPLSLVAFVDVLGFTDQVLHIQTKSDLDSLDSRIRQVQDHFSVRTKDVIQREANQVSKREVLAFSDCIVVSAALDSDVSRIQGAFDTLMWEIASLAISQADCIANGVFLRGAVDLGIWHRTKDRLISPALARAYQLERAAVVPIIRLSDAAKRYFHSHVHRHFYSEDIDPVSNSFLIYRDLETKQSFWFIDYMHLCINNLDWRVDHETQRKYLATSPDKRGEVIDEGYHSNVKRWLQMHRDAVLRNYLLADEPKVRTKYQWLAKYHNATVSQYMKPFRTTYLSSREIPSARGRFQIRKLPKRRTSKSMMLAALREQQRLARMG